MSRRASSRWIATALAIAAVLGAAATATGTAVTESAWSDRAHTSAAVTAGTWEEPTSAEGCTAMDSTGKSVAGGTCKITSVTFQQWSDGKNTVRDYYVGVAMTGDVSYPRFTVDLSKGTGTGTWNWKTAGTIATNQFTPISGYACTELPILRANGPVNWGTSYSIWVRVVMEPTGAGASRNCS